MLEVPATEVAKRFSQYRQAAQREPVGVTHHRRITEVLISKQDYDEFVRLKNLSTRSLRPSELSEAAIRALMEAEMDSCYDELNALLDG